MNGACGAPGYRYVTLDDAFELFYSGLIVGDEVTLCTNGYMSNGLCTSYTTGNCSSGNYTAGSGLSFIAPVNGTCDAPGYRYATIDNAFYGIYNGMLVGNEVTLCTNGRMVNGTCTAYSTGDCISNYYDTGIDTNTFAESSNDACSSPYSIYADATRCDHNAGDTCVTLPSPHVDITWRDHTGATLTTNTCYIGEAITIPTAPSRRGYKFTGWKVVSQ